MAYSDLVTLIKANPAWQQDATPPMTPDQVAAAIDAYTITQPCVITSSQMLQWLGQNGRYYMLEQLAADTTQTAAVHSVAAVALLMLQRSDTVIDFTNSSDQSMYSLIAGATVNINGTQTPVLSEADAAALQAMGQQQVLWTSVYWQGGLNGSHVASAWSMIAQGA